MLENLVFHESFDSTRTADRDAEPNLAQAQAEALVSLLLGHTLTVPNTYAFDSRGVLDLISAVLSAREEVSSGLRRGSPARERLTEARPFLLCWHGSDSFLEACANQLRNSEPLNERFVLSAWNAIDLKPEMRRDLADALLAAPRPEPPAWLKDYDDFPEHFDALRAIDQYAAEYGRGRPTSSAAGTDLITYLEYYHELGASDGQLDALAPVWGCPADIAMALRQRLHEEMVKAAAEKNRKDQKRLTRRSWVHVAVREAREQRRSDLQLLEQLKELIDTFYNARLAQSAYAEHGFLSSVPRSADNDLEQVNDLAVRVIGHLRSNTSEPPLRGVFTASANVPYLEVAPLRRLFQAYWEIIGDDERCGTWHASCNRVNKLLGERPPTPSSRQRSGWTSRFKEAWSDHMSLLSRQLPQVVRTDDSTLWVTVRLNQAEYQQAHHAWSVADEEIRPVTAEEVETTLATGRYVSDIAAGVSE